MEKIFASMKSIECAPGVEVFNVLIEAYASRAARLMAEDAERQKNGGVNKKKVRVRNKEGDTDADAPPAEEDLATQIAALTERAGGILQQLASDGVKPDMGTYNAYLRLQINSGDIEAASNFFYSMLEEGIAPNDDTYNTMVKGALDHDRFDLAQHFIGGMEEFYELAPHVSYDMIQHCIWRGELKTAMETFENLCENWSVKRKRRVEELEEGLHVEQDADPATTKLLTLGSEHIQLSVQFLVDRLVTLRHKDKALAVVDKVFEIGVPLNGKKMESVIQPFTHAGHLKESLHIAEKCREAEISLTLPCYEALITICCQQGEIDTAKGFRVDMLRNSIEPSFSIYQAFMEGHLQQENQEWEVFAIFSNLKKDIETKHRKAFAQLQQQAPRKRFNDLSDPLILRQRQELQQRIPIGIYNLALSSLATNFDIEQIKAVWDELQVHSGLKPPPSELFAFYESEPPSRNPSKRGKDHYKPLKRKPSIKQLMATLPFTVEPPNQTTFEIILRAALNLNEDLLASQVFQTMWNSDLNGKHIRIRDIKPLLLELFRAHVQARRYNHAGEVLVWMRSVEAPSGGEEDVNGGNPGSTKPATSS
ncbi:hypothetical protein HK102_009761, partial [Quaeritorhiza haematococci]